MKRWIRSALALTAAAMRVGRSLSRRTHWRLMVKSDWNYVKNQWRDLTPSRLRQFTAAGVNINMRDKEGNTPLHVTVAFNVHARVIKEASSKRAQISMPKITLATHRFIMLL